MKKGLFALTCVVLTAILVTPTSTRLGAQGRPNSTLGWTAPRTADGHPDLQGVWFFGTLTPLERPAKLAGRTHLTDEEIADIEKSTADAAVRNASFGFFGDTSKYAYDKRTSLVVDPPDGKMPPLTSSGRERSIAHITRISRLPNGPEDRSIWDRCILGWNSGPPMIPTVPAGYNQNVQLFQTRDYFVILNEQVHNAAYRAAGRASTWAAATVGWRFPRPVGRSDTRRR